VLVTTATPPLDRRARILEGLAQAVREKGLQRTQIADVVRHAHTSRRTFYECFADKESAFVELIRESSIAIRALVEAAVDPQAPWETQIDAAIDAYFAALGSDPALVATVSRELPTLGDRGAALQHEGVERFAQLVVELTRGPGMRRAAVKAVTLEEAAMLMGGVAELVARAVHEERPLSQAASTAKTVIKAAIGPRSPSVSRPQSRAASPTRSPRPT
jgi:AcrR family transcriptional regulator